MKLNQAIIFLLILFVNFTIAQEELSKPYDMNNEKIVITESENNNSILGIEITERIITTSVIIGELGILLFVLFYWKKTRTDSSCKGKNIYKRNIMAIRDERVKPIMDIKVSRKRRSLNNLSIIKKLNGKTITSTAKKLSVAKGELYLAARIQQMQEQAR
ncbi:MAG: hypothetical protein OQJ81_05290 [Melioribacteraceae bacterium]|nr:hypothetical protein [Melioribacteraceae bacterium]